MKNKRMFKILVLILIVIFSSICGVCAERMIASNKVTYSNGTSGLTSNNVQGAIDELYVKCNKNSGVTFNFAKFLEAMEGSDTVIADDETSDHNMRYTGKTPNNYVTFEGELWRVIGVFNNVDNGSGDKKTRVKIVRNESIGDQQWHTSDVNVWKNATLNARLQALVGASSNLIENAIWYLGDPGGTYTYTASQAYTYERGTKVAIGNDATWTGKVGLMYPSDYGFASSNCKDGSHNLNLYSTAVCRESNWIYLRYPEWLLSPRADLTTHARPISTSGYVTDTNPVSGSYAIRPVVYLKSSVICKNCYDENAGTKGNPFQIE